MTHRIPGAAAFAAALLAAAPTAAAQVIAIEGGTVACHAIEEGRLAVEERSFAAPTDQRA